MTSTPHTIDLHDWSVQVIEATESFRAPEECVARLHGRAYNDPRREDGTNVFTSGIAKVLPGRIVVTESGSRYRLHTPHPEYVRWCEHHGKEPPGDEWPIRPISKLKDQT